MITYGYAIYYKDKDGFDQPIADESGAFLIFTTENRAKEVLVDKKEKAYKQWRPDPEVITEGMLWWKKSYNVPSKISPVETALGRQIYNTIGIKKVKVV